MIVDSPLITDLALGVDRRIPQDGDAQLIVPALVTPTVPLVRPVSVVPNSGVIIRESFTTTKNSQNTNAAQIDFTLVVMAKGLWELEGSLSSIFDFTSTTFAIGSQVHLLYQTNQFQILSHEPQIGTQTTTFSFAFLFQENATLLLRQGITGAAEHIGSRLFVNGKRLL